MNKEELIGEVPTVGSLDCSYYEAMLFEILRKMSKKTADLQVLASGEDPSLFNTLLGEILWETDLKRKMALFGLQGQCP